MEKGFYNGSMPLKAEECGQNQKPHSQPLPDQSTHATPAQPRPEPPLAPATVSRDGGSKLVGEPKENGQRVLVVDSPSVTVVPSGDTPMQEA